MLSSTLASLWCRIFTDFGGEHPNEGVSPTMPGEPYLLTRRIQG